jgi:hypothetical protein
MGLLKHLLFWPVTGPKFLIDFSLGKVEGVVREELTDDSAVKAELMELQLLVETGDIDDDEYLRREELLMQRLREIREWREEFGMGVAGGPVRVAARADDEEVVQPAPETAEEERTPQSPPPDPTDPSEGPQVANPADVTIDVHLDFD